MDALPEEQTEKLRALNRMKWFASSLFMLVTATYIVARVFEPRHPSLALVAAFAEAAMVGALADWFAVVALFRHPLGLPIPHTAIIPKNKARLAGNLGAFIAGNFLGTATILERIRAFNPAARLAAWLTRRECAQTVVDHAARGMLFWLDAVEDARVQRFLHDAVTARLKSLDLAHLAGDLLAVLTQHGRHQQLLDRTLRVVGALLGRKATRAVLAELIQKNLNAMMRAFNFRNVIGHYLARKLVVGFAHFLREVAADAHHPFRRKFDAIIEELIVKLRTDPQFRLAGERIRDQILTSPEAADYLKGLWLHVRDWLKHDFADPHSGIRQQAVSAVLDIGARLDADPQMQQWINETIERAATALVERNREKAGKFIADQVGAWDDRHMVAQVELNIGKDLQFIRINGTLVGGLVGLVIFGLNNLLKV